MISIAVCDDEEYMLAELREKITKYMKDSGFSCAVDCFRSAGELLAAGTVYDILFLDIQMESLSGMEAAKRIRRSDRECEIIFVSVLREPVYDAFDVEASGYLVKPVDERKLYRTLGRAAGNILERRSQYLTIQKGQNYLKLKLSDIYYCEVIKRKIYVHLERETLDYYDTLERLEKSLPNWFFRCHRSYLVNLSHVRGFHHDNAVLDNKAFVPVSKLRRQAFADELLKFMKSGR